MTHNKLKEAQKLQNQIESKILLKFWGLSVIFGLASLIAVVYTGLIEKSVTFYLLPCIIVFYIGKKTNIHQMLSPKSITGEVINIDIYVVKSQRVKGERSYIINQGLEAEIMIKDKNGKTHIRVFQNGDTTSRLCIGDQIAFLRFIDEPIVIKGNYLK